MKTVMEIEGEQFERELGAVAEPVLVHFYASWSGQCRILAPTLEQLAAELGDELRVARVNLAHCPELAGRYAITDVPALILFEDGRPIACIDAEMLPRQMKVKLQGLLADYVMPR
ncbi:MAG: thioredoxin [Verrucomicrobiae bacterium]|nr:thioredoxin [Verrucomicrobiae bacterium]